MQAVILTAGKGKRIRPITKWIPKSLINFNGKTILDIQLEWLKSQFVSNILVLIGYKGTQISNHLRMRKGEKPVVVRVCKNNANPPGTGGTLQKALPLLECEFVCLYGDVFCPIDLKSLWKLHIKKSAGLTMTVFPRVNNPTDPNNVDYENDLVTCYAKDGKQHKAIEAGVFVMERYLIESVKGSSWDLEYKIFPQIVRNGRVGAFESPIEPLEVGSFKGIERFKKVMKVKK